MSDARPGWYADPSGQADLRWWDGQVWTASTRARPEVPPTATAPSAPAATIAPSAPSPPPPTTPDTPAVTAPFVPPGQPSSAPSSAAAPPPPPPAPPAAPASSPAGWALPPGSFADWGSTSASPAWNAVTSPVPAAAPAQPPDGNRSRSWVPWALTGAGVALIVVLVGFLVVSVLGTSSTPSSSGLAAGSTTTTTNRATGSSGSSSSSSSSTTEATTTTTLPAAPGTPTGPSGSVLYTDPGGIYSVSVASTWTRAPRRIDGIPLWYVTTPDSQGVRAAYDVTTETLRISMGLDQYVELAEEALRASPAFHLISTTNITLADGVPATIVRYDTQQHGVTLEGEAVIAVSSSNAVVETITASPASAPTAFAQAFPYLRTLHLL